MKYSLETMDSLGGTELEYYLCDLLREHGYVHNQHGIDHMSQDYASTGQPQFHYQLRISHRLLKNYGWADIAIVNSVHPKGAIIEAKGQSTPGSVDEKAIGMAVQAAYSQYPTYIVANSDHWSRARDWFNGKYVCKAGFEAINYHLGFIVGAYTCSQFRESFFQNVS